MNNDLETEYKVNRVTEDKKEDQKYIAAVQQGDRESFRFLVDKYKERTYYAALMYSGNREEALDLSQEAFVRAYRAIDRFEKGRHFYTWLYQILKNLCVNHYHRRKKRSVNFSDAEEQIGQSLYRSHAPEPDEIFEANETRDKVWQGLHQLKQEDREIIVMKEFDELSYKEIAEILDIPIGSVMSRLYYARQRLAKKLEKLL